MKQTKIHLWGTCHLFQVEKATEISGKTGCPRASALALHYRQYHSHVSDEVQLFPVEKIHKNKNNELEKKLPLINIAYCALE